MISELDVLTESECIDVREIVHELRPLWIPRHVIYPFYTLATASYIDAAVFGGFQKYCEMAVTSNQILKDHLKWLYSRVETALESHLGAPVCTHERFARPGFHIFLAHDFFRQAIASVHCDLQHLLLDWGPAESVDLENPLSFTLSISLPKSGAGINVWNAHHFEVKDFSPLTKDFFLRSRDKIQVSYQPGRMVLHSGLSVHQIAPMTDAEPGEERITLQGHAVFSRGAWQLYW